MNAVSNDKTNEHTKEEQDKTFSTFESNRREKEKAEEMMPESFEDDDIASTDEEDAED